MSIFLITSLPARNVTFLPSAYLFFKIIFSFVSFGNITRVQTVWIVDTDQDRRFVGTALGPNFLQRVPTDDNIWHKEAKSSAMTEN